MTAHGTTSTTHPVSPRTEGPLTRTPKLSTVLIASLAAGTLILLAAIGVIYYYTTAYNDPVELDAPGRVVDPVVFDGV